MSKQLKNLYLSSTIIQASDISALSNDVATLSAKVQELSGSSNVGNTTTGTLSQADLAKITLSIETQHNYTDSRVDALELSTQAQIQRLEATDQQTNLSVSQLASKVDNDYRLNELSTKYEQQIAALQNQVAVMQRALSRFVLAEQLSAYETVECGISGIAFECDSDTQTSGATEVTLTFVNGQLTQSTTDEVTTGKVILIDNANAIDVYEFGIVSGKMTTSRIISPTNEQYDLAKRQFVITDTETDTEYSIFIYNGVLAKQQYN